MAISYNTSIVRNGLVLHLDAANRKSYPGSGTAWNDLSGNGNNGTLVNGVGYSGSNNGILTFDGINDYATTGDAILLNSGLASSSFSAWWRYSGQGSGADKRGFVLESESFNHSLLVNTNGTLGVHINTTGNGTQYVPGFTPTTNVWYNSSVVWDGTNLIVYINGVEVGRRSQGGTSLVVQKLRIGTYRDNNERWWLGNISQITTYNRSLSASEVAQNFNALRGRYGL